MLTNPNIVKADPQINVAYSVNKIYCDKSQQINNIL